jgi:hypothetical protein
MEEVGRWWQKLKYPPGYKFLIKNTIQKTRLYKFILVAYSQLLLAYKYTPP